MNEQIKVEILQEGLTAKEVNFNVKPFPPDPNKRRAYDGQMEAYDYFYNQWKEAEDKLRTFTIDSWQFKPGKMGEVVRFPPQQIGRIYDAEIIEGNKIKLINC
jgi:hypothetical protein